MLLQVDKRMKAAWLFGLLAVSTALPTEVSKKHVKEIGSIANSGWGLAVRAPLPMFDVVPEVEPAPGIGGEEAGTSGATTSEGSGTGHLGSTEGRPATEDPPSGGTMHLGSPEPAKPVVPDDGADAVPTDSSVIDTVPWGKPEWQTTFQKAYMRRTYSQIPFGKFRANGNLDGGAGSGGVFSDGSKTFLQNKVGINVDTDPTDVVRINAGNDLADVYRGYFDKDKGVAFVTRTYRTGIESTGKYDNVPVESDRVPISELQYHEWTRLYGDAPVNDVVVGSISNGDTKTIIQNIIKGHGGDANGVGEATIVEADDPTTWNTLLDSSAGSFVKSMLKNHPNGKSITSVDLRYGGVSDDFYVVWHMT